MLPKERLSINSKFSSLFSKASSITETHFFNTSKSNLTKGRLVFSFLNETPKCLSLTSSIFKTPCKIHNLIGNEKIFDSLLNKKSNQISNEAFC